MPSPCALAPACWAVQFVTCSIERERSRERELERERENERKREKEWRVGEDDVMALRVSRASLCPTGERRVPPWLQSDYIATVMFQ